MGIPHNSNIYILNDAGFTSSTVTLKKSSDVATDAALYREERSQSFVGFCMHTTE